MLTKEEKELKKFYIDTLIEENNENREKWESYYSQTIERVVRLSDGRMIAINKPSIEKDFCFGYSDSAYDTEDYDRANDMAEHARTSEDYFMEQNLKKVDRCIEDLNYDKIYTRVLRWKAPETSKIHDLAIYRSQYEADNENAFKIYKVSDEDVMLLIDGYKKVKESFEKRLKTYLKKYGMSKVNSWSYWRDE